jgi:hypothetical protein
MQFNIMLFAIAATVPFVLAQGCQSKLHPKGGVTKTDDGSFLPDYQQCGFIVEYGTHSVVRHVPDGKDLNFDVYYDNGAFNVYVTGAATPVIVEQTRPTQWAD